MNNLKQISSAQHPLVKHWVKLRTDKDYRYQNERVLIEGKKIISELGKQLVFPFLIATNKNLIPAHIKAEEVIIVPDTVMKKISGVQTSEGIMAEIPMPDQKDIEDKDYILVLDGINDPGNMGTILRTALALGWEAVFITEGSCDPYNDKAIRAAKGATFKIPLMIGKWENLNPMIASGKWQLLAADLTGVKLGKVPESSRRLLVLGNEAQGPSAEVLSCCTKVTIPMDKNMESLNVSIAGAILMYELGNKR